MAMLEQKNGQKPGKKSPFVRVPDRKSQPIGRGRIGRVGPVVVRESREQCDNFFAGNI